MQNEEVIILMATFNGSKFIMQQIESIINQTYNRWELIIRDDGSNDQTVKIIREIQKNDKRITFIKTMGPGYSACANFSKLFDWSKRNRDVNYIMFADQDDIWRPNKIEKTLLKIQEAEKMNSYLPILAYGNLKLIDDNSNFLASKIELTKYIEFNKAILQNPAFGCTMMLNRALIDKIPTIPENAVNHDHWITLTATAFGKTIFLEEALILYRRHRLNVSSQGNSLKSRLQKYVFNVNKEKNQLKYIQRTLYTFLVVYNNQLDFKLKALINTYLNAYRTNRFNVIYYSYKLRILNNTLLQNFGLFYLILFFYKSIKYNKY